MNGRYERYSENTSGMSRVNRNSELYKKINDEELENYTVRSNATVLGNQEPEIDIEKIKKILDKRYNEAPKRKSIRIETTEEEPKMTYDDTKEYDLNAVLEKAKTEKSESYDEVRAKKLRDTQFDILNNLHIEKDEDEIDKTTEQKQEELMELINTITINEKKKKDEEEATADDDPLDLLSDLKGDEGTAVYESMASVVTTTIEKVKEQEKDEEEETTTSQEEKPKNSKIDNSFYTNSLFKKKDFVDDDFVDEGKMGIGVKILIVLVIIAFLIGLFLFLKSFFNF